VELCLESARATPDPRLKEKLNNMAAQALDRAESIKQPKTGTKVRELLPSLQCCGSVNISFGSGSANP
jgi:hypothetical protein